MALLSASLLVQEGLDHRGQLVALGQRRRGARRGRGAAGRAGSAAACIRGLTAGMIGSSSPPITSVGCRIRPQERQAAPAGHRGQLVVVAALGPRPGGGVQQVRHRARDRCACCRRRSRRRRCAAYAGSRWRRGVDILASTRGWAGTISAPVPVATSTTRRTRRRDWTASCWASPPPQESPSTSNCGGRAWPSARSPTTTARRSGRGGAAAALPPTPGTSKRTTPRSGSRRVDQRLERLEADADAVAQQQRRLVDQPAARRAAPRPGPGCRAPRSCGSGRCPRATGRLSGHGRRCPARRRSARRRAEPIRRRLVALRRRCARPATRRSRPTSCP